MSVLIRQPARPGHAPSGDAATPGRLSALWSVLRDTAGASAVRRGILGAVFVAFGALTPAYLPDATWLAQRPGMEFFRSLSGRTLGTVVGMLGVGLMLDAWFRLRPRRGRAGLDLRAVFALWSLPFLLAPPVFSADAYAYAAEGWLMRNGLNPYEVGVGALPGIFADQTALVWRWTPAPYGPLDLQLNHLVVGLTGAHPWVSVLAMRIPVLLGLAAVVWVLPKLAERVGVSPALSLWLAVANPLAIVHFVGGVHNDAIMLGLVFVALYAATRGRLVLAAALVGAAAAVKVPAIVAVLAVAVLADPMLSRLNTLSLPERFKPVLSERSRRLRMIRRAFVAGVITLAAFLGINLATGLGFGWIAGMNVPGMVRTMSPSTLIGDGLGLFFASLGHYGLAFGSLRVVRTVFMLSCVALILFISLRVAHRRPIAALCWSLLSVAFFGPVLHGWYVFWGGALLGLTRPSVRVQRLAIWLSSGLLGYIAMNAAWKNGVTLLGAAALGLIAWRVWLHDLDERAGSTDFLPALDPALELAPARSAVR